MVDHVQTWFTFLVFCHFVAERGQEEPKLYIVSDHSAVRLLCCGIVTQKFIVRSCQYWKEKALNLSFHLVNSEKCSVSKQTGRLTSLTETLVPLTHGHPIMQHLQQFPLHIHFVDHMKVVVVAAGCSKFFLDIYVCVYTYHIIYMCLWDIYVCLPAYFLCCEAMASLCGEGQNLSSCNNQIWFR